MWVKLCGLLLVALATGCQSAVPVAGPTPPPTAAAQRAVLTARIVAVGIPGASAVSPVGQFHAGGPIHDKPEFAAYTAPGKVLDPDRILVTSTSNFSAPKTREEQPEGIALSLDPRDPQTIVVPSTFASPGGQASAVNFSDKATT